MHAAGRDDLAGDPRLADNAGRVAHRSEVDDAIARWTRTLEADRVLAILDGAGVPAGPIYNVADMMEDPQYNARGLFETVETEGGPLKIPGHHPKLGRTPGATLMARPGARGAQPGDLHRRPRPRRGGTPLARSRRDRMTPRRERGAQSSLRAAAMSPVRHDRGEHDGVEPVGEPDFEAGKLGVNTGFERGELGVNAFSRVSSLASTLFSRAFDPAFECADPAFECVDPAFEGGESGIDSGLEGGESGIDTGFECSESGIDTGFERIDVRLRGSAFIAVVDGLSDGFRRVRVRYRRLRGRGRC